MKRESLEFGVHEATRGTLYQQLFATRLTALTWKADKSVRGDLLQPESRAVPNSMLSQSTVCRILCQGIPKARRSALRASQTLCKLII